MIPFPTGAVDKLKQRVTELTDVAWECRIVDQHTHPADGKLTDLCEECGARAKKIIDQAKDDMIAEGMKLLAAMSRHGS